jgi:hypothetical protein
METNGTADRSGFSAAFHRIGTLPRQLESDLRAHPFATAVTVAGVSFAVGTLLGSRVARAVLVAAIPALVQRLLNGPLGDDLLRYIRGAPGSSAAPHRGTAS